MSDNKTDEVEVPSTSAAAVSSESAKTKILPWVRLYRAEIAVVAIILAAGVAVATLISTSSDRLREAVKAADIESAYRDVFGQRVAVNGYRGTEEWRGYYKLGLERYLGQHDFSDLCTPNGFLKDSYVTGALPCIAVGDVRAVRAYDGTISFFQEDNWRRMTRPLDVLEQDVHAIDYVDIDALSKAVEDRATKQASEAKAAVAQKDADENRRVFQDALKSIFPMQVPLRQEPMIVPEPPVQFSVPENAE